jgi:hypothetical protein
VPAGMARCRPGGEGQVAVAAKGRWQWQAGCCPNGGAKGEVTRDCSFWGPAARGGRALLVIGKNPPQQQGSQILTSASGDAIWGEG